MDNGPELIAWALRDSGPPHRGGLLADSRCYGCSRPRRCTTAIASTAGGSHP